MPRYSVKEISANVAMATSRTTETTRHACLERTAVTENVFLLIARKKDIIPQNIPPRSIKTEILWPSAKNTTIILTARTIICYIFSTTRPKNYIIIADEALRRF